MEENNQGKSSLGMQENLEALLCYVFGFITGIIFFVLEKESNYVKFHAMQSILFSAALFIINIVLGFIPIIGWLLGLLLSLASFAMWIIFMVKAYKGERFKFPVIGDIAEQQINKQ